MKKIVTVQPVGGYRLELVFSDGVGGVVDLSDIPRRGVFGVWNDGSSFSRVRAGTAGELVWDSGIDLCPDALYLRLTGKTVESLFPNLREDSVHA